MKKEALLFFFLFAALAESQYLFSIDVEVHEGNRLFYPGDTIIVNSDIKSLGLHLGCWKI